MLLRPVPVICSKIAFLRTTLSEFQHTAPILKANSEAEVDLWGGDDGLVFRRRHSFLLALASSAFALFWIWNWVQVNPGRRLGS